MQTREADLIRERFTLTHKINNHIQIGKNSLLNFCSNDYLNLSTHPSIKKAFIQGVQHYGLGSNSSALVSGFYHAHQQLEEAFAEFLQYDKTLLFNSGYLANTNIIRALVKRQGKIFADKFCHASLLDGIQLSRANCRRYLHNDLNHLKAMLTFTNKNDLLITESVFSMEGNISPIDQIIQLIKPHAIQLMVDDAHGAGVLGKHGRGIIEHHHLTQKDVPCLVVPLGKSFASMGAIVAGSHELIEHLMQRSKAYCYSTALPPAIATATLIALNIVKQETWRREKLQSLIKFFIDQAAQRALTLFSNDLTPIKSILIGDNKITLRIKEKLQQHGFFIACIRPPTVPRGTARIRISLNCMHHENDITHLLDLIKKYIDLFHA